MGLYPGGAPNAADYLYPPLPPLPEQTRRAAMLLAAGRATGAEDLADILAVLGLLPPRGPPEPMQSASQDASQCG